MMTVWIGNEGQWYWFILNTNSRGRSFTFTSSVGDRTPTEKYKNMGKTAPILRAYFPGDFILYKRLFGPHRTWKQMLIFVLKFVLLFSMSIPWEFSAWTNPNQIEPLLRFSFQIFQNDVKTYLALVLVVESCVWDAIISLWISIDNCICVHVPSFHS